MHLAWPLGIAVAGLAITLALIWFLHPSPALIEDWKWLHKGWFAGVTATAAIAAGTWFFRRRTIAHSAQRLDRKLDAKNRLETATALRLSLIHI